MVLSILHSQVVGRELEGFHNDGGQHRLDAECIVCGELCGHREESRTTTAPHECGHRFGGMETQTDSVA